MAFVKEIKPNTVDSHQVSPGYVLTFLRWSNRSTRYYQTEPALDVRNPFTVVNDAISITVSNDKKGLMPTAQIVLKGGDINYATAVHPGDFVMINMLNWETDVFRVQSKASAQQPVNEYGDGFKGVFKIQNTVKNLKVDPKSGRKVLTYTISAAGFTEFNNVIYYNPALAAAFADAGAAMWSTAVGEYYQDKLKTVSKIQSIVPDLFEILIGKSRKKFNSKVKNFGNTHFRVPDTLGRLLGRGRDAKYATDIFTYVVGIWRDSTTGSDLGSGMNPGISSFFGSNFLETGIDLEGNKRVYLENWNNNTAWSIINGNINATLNEMYTTYRIDPNNSIQPTVVVRQKPFTTEHFRGFSKATKFLKLPRWKVDPTLIMGFSISKNEAARFNFVQVFTRSQSDTAANNMAAQIASENFQVDDGDIQRHGLRPYIQTSNFDFPADKAQNDLSLKDIRAPKWAELVADWIIDGHLKESGTFQLQGIQDPISVGDNFEFDNVVYHIESVTHTMTVMPNGFKNFKTNLTVSYGMDLASSRLGPVYPNMEHTDAHTRNQDDFDHERVLPGISDTQDIQSRRRSGGEEVRETRQKSFTPVPGKRRPKVKDNKGNTSKPSNDSGSKGTRGSRGKS